MNLNDRFTDNVPTDAGNLGDMAVFMRDRAGRTKNHVRNWSLPEISQFVDRGLLSRQFFPADDIGRVR